MKNFLHRMDSMLNCIIRSFKEVHKNRIIALKITESLKRNKALSEENLTTPFEYEMCIRDRGKTYGRTEEEDINRR